MAGTSYPVPSKGGYAITRLVSAGSLVSVPNGQWELHDDPNLTNTTESDSTGSRYSPTTPNPMATIRLVRREDPSYFEAIGWSPGRQLESVWLQLGTMSSGVGGQKAHLISQCTVGKIVEVKNEQNDVIRLEIELVGGLVTRYQAVPSS